MKKVKAKSQYTCDLTNKIIHIGEIYKRVNIRGIGIFHFKKECSDYAIKKYINEYYCLEEYPTHLFPYGENGFEY
jgi:hypothetical protein